MPYEEDLSKHYETRDHRRVRILLEDFGDEIRIHDQNDRLIGLIQLKLFDEEHGSWYYITWMYLDIVDQSFLRQGIGRAALIFHLDIFKTPIFAAENDGMKREDGSHLTGDAPSFVNRMRFERIIETPASHRSDD